MAKFRKKPVVIEAWRNVLEDAMPEWVKGAIKIGVAGNVHGRLGQVQMCNPHEVTLLAYAAGGYDLERRLHERFAADRIRGEWFRDTPALRAEIERLCPTENGLPIALRQAADALAETFGRLG